MGRGPTWTWRVALKWATRQPTMVMDCCAGAGGWWAHCDRRGGRAGDCALHVAESARSRRGRQRDCWTARYRLRCSAQILRYRRNRVRTADPSADDRIPRPPLQTAGILALLSTRKWLSFIYNTNTLTRCTSMTISCKRRRRVASLGWSDWASSGIQTGRRIRRQEEWPDWNPEWWSICLCRQLQQVHVRSRGFESSRASDRRHPGLSTSTVLLL